MKLFRRILKSIANRIIGKRNIIKLIDLLSRSINMDVIDVAYWNMGIMKYQLEEESTGEHFLINKIIKNQLPNNAILFDVGANEGSFSKILRQAFPNGVIYAFEPNEIIFKKLQENTLTQNVVSCNLGLGAKEGEATLYLYEGEDTSQFATIYPNVLSDIHKIQKKVIESRIVITTVDSFCQEKNIKTIDFLKIDTEGNEYSVLQGCQKILLNHPIKFILFEFNEMNIISRVFLKDFYDLLKEYNFYRLDTNRLIPIFNYLSKNEIFKFQNIVAVHKSIEMKHV